MKTKWSKKETVYQIYPRSFNDSNGDGIGDLQGIIRKLDYLKDLGVGIIWLSPIYSSPMADNGYDISDYLNIHHEFGTMADFDELITKAHQKGLKLIMDLVINHTSDEHPWFIEASKSKDSPYHDYYLWKDKPNNWTSFFGGKAWEYNKATNEYYLHLFHKKQPDLNWENPKVREEIKGILRFWLDKGVDGFRCDVINLLSKKSGLPNGFPSPVLCGHEHYLNGPKIHDYLQELKRDVFNHYDCFTVGECVFLNPKKALTYIEDEKELNMVFQFEHMMADNFFIKWFPIKYKPLKLKKAFVKWQYQINPKAWNTLYLENHDQPRSVSRFGSQEYHYASCSMLATILLLQKGTAFIYQGQEIGMTNAPFFDINDYRDIETLSMYKNFSPLFGKKKMMSKIQKMSRDHARTPMQWDNSLNAGFSKATPWLKVNDNYHTINVKNNLENPNSLYYYYQKLLKLRQEEVFLLGTFIDRFPCHKTIFFYKRLYKGKEVIVVANMTKKNKVKVSFNFNNYQLLISNYENNLQYFQAYEVRVYQKENEND